MQKNKERCVRVELDSNEIAVVAFLMGAGMASLPDGVTVDFTVVQSVMRKLNGEG